jgi:hypothetical protein
MVIGRRSSRPPTSRRPNRPAVGSWPDACRVCTGFRIDELGLADLISSPDSDRSRRQGRPDGSGPWLASDGVAAQEICRRIRVGELKAYHLGGGRVPDRRGRSPRQHPAPRAGVVTASLPGDRGTRGDGIDARPTDLPGELRADCRGTRSPVPSLLSHHNTNQEPRVHAARGGGSIEIVHRRHPGTGGRKFLQATPSLERPASEALGGREQSEGQTSEDIGEARGDVPGTNRGTPEKILHDGKNGPGTFSFQALGRCREAPSIKQREPPWSASAGRPALSILLRQDVPCLRSAPSGTTASPTRCPRVSSWLSVGDRGLARDRLPGTWLRVGHAYPAGSPSGYPEVRGTRVAIDCTAPSPRATAAAASILLVLMHHRTCIPVTGVASLRGISRR